MNIVLWGDSLGVAKAVEVVGDRSIAGIVAAANRRADWAELGRLARSLDVPRLIQPFRKDVEASSEFADSLQRLGADLFLISSYSMILPADWLTMPALGAVNIHGGLLPQYRGANVLNWVLVNGERETGVTIHYVDSGIDTGDVILEKRLAVGFEDTALSLRTKLSALWPSALAEVLPMIEKGDCPRTPQDQSKAKHWPRRRPEDGHIDWNWPAERIYNLIRALVKPWPGAFYETSSGRVTIDEFLTMDQVEEMKRRIIGDREAA